MISKKLHYALLPLWIALVTFSLYILTKKHIVDIDIRSFTYWNFLLIAVFNTTIGIVNRLYSSTERWLSVFFLAFFFYALYLLTTISVWILHPVSQDIIIWTGFYFYNNYLYAGKKIDDSKTFYLSVRNNSFSVIKQNTAWNEFIKISTGETDFNKLSALIDFPIPFNKRNADCRILDIKIHDKEAVLIVRGEKYYHLFHLDNTQNAFRINRSENNEPGMIQAILKRAQQ